MTLLEIIFLIISYSSLLSKTSIYLNLMTLTETEGAIFPLRLVIVFIHHQYEIG